MKPDYYIALYDGSGDEIPLMAIGSNSPRGVGLLKTKRVALSLSKMLSRKHGYTFTENKSKRYFQIFDGGVKIMTLKVKTIVDSYEKS